MFWRRKKNWNFFPYNIFCVLGSIILSPLCIYDKDKTSNYLLLIQGDSGGPVFKYRPTLSKQGMEAVLIGVIALGDKHCTAYGKGVAVYASSIGFFRNWIEQTMKK